MAEGRIKNTELSAIAAAIRSKNGEGTTYKPGEMAAAIEAIPTGTTPAGTVNITQNGTTDVTQYASASVNVPNSYSQSDEGKVVSNGELVAQTARSSAITENGTYDTTLNNSVVVNVSGGGEPTLPTAYQEVEYITFSGTQNFKVQNTPAYAMIHVRASNSVSASESAVVGYRGASSASADFAIQFQSGTLKLYVRSGSYADVLSGPTPSGSALNTARRFSVQTINGHTNFFVGCYSELDTTYAAFSGNLYELMVYSYTPSSSALEIAPALKFVPCYRIADDVIGMYELYTGTFYTNEGSGSFGKGPDVT